MDGKTTAVDVERITTDLRANLKSQYRAGLAMFRQAVDRCPEDAWLDDEPENVFAEFDEAAFAAASEEPEHSARNRQIRSRVQEALGQLPNRQRQVFVLRHIEGWSTQEVATALSMSTGTVKRHLFRAVARLRAALGDMR